MHVEGTRGRCLVSFRNGVRFLVEGGDSIRYAIGRGTAGATEADIRAFVWSAPWTALACQRVLLPLHASAVARGGDVHAISGRGGAGKSTLAAVLAANGLALFADDLVIVNAAQAKRRMYAWGVPNLKLFPDALALAGAKAESRVRQERGPDKYYAAPATHAVQSAGVIRTLHRLEDQEAVRGEREITEPVSGVEAVALARRAVSRPSLAAVELGPDRLYEWLAALAKAVRAFKLHRRARDGPEEVATLLARSLSTPPESATTTRGADSCAPRTAPRACSTR